MRALTLLFHLPRNLLITLVRGYRFFLSPWVGQGCRFEPTCSGYALEALATHGALGGATLTTWRLLRCHPLCAGGHDPVPDNAPWRRPRPRPSDPRASGLFTGLLRRDAAAASAQEDPPLSKTTP